MNETIHALSVLFGACFVVMAIGGSLMFGIASVCRWMKWAPLNITVNVNSYAKEVPSTLSSHRGDQT
jgi:hypothetical protein